MGSEEPLEVEISASLDGQRVDRLVSLVADVSRATARSLIDDRAVTVSGAVVERPSQRVVSGEILRIEGPVRVVTDTPVPDDSIPIEIVHRDPHIMVVNKPAGLVVHPGSGHPDGTLVNALLAVAPEMVGVGDPSRPGIVHRLDAGTTGLLVVALTVAAFDRLVAMLAAREVERSYRALCVGTIEPPAGLIDAPVGRSSRDPTAMAVVADGRPARTRYRRLDAAHDVSLVECRLETGRTHQIRVHLGAHGFPVLGDTRYGGATSLSGVERPMLHARSLAFEHPVTGGQVRFSSPYPDDFADVMESLDLSEDRSVGGGED